jgi:hypothetical protein
VVLAAAVRVVQEILIHYQLVVLVPQVKVTEAVMLLVSMAGWLCLQAEVVLAVKVQMSHLQV